MLRNWRPNWITVGVACLLGWLAIRDGRTFTSGGLAILGYVFFTFAFGLSLYLLSRKSGNTTSK